MSLPTISLSLIAKNEEKNIRRLLDSVKDCFQEIILVDTGSTDKTKEIALEYGCKVYDFEWVNSFSKARNFSFSKCTMDYICWMDLDDCLSDREAFIKWRDTAMQLNKAWFVTYHYAIDQFGKPIISFVRERVFKRDLNPTWNYDLHEGIIVQPDWQPSYVVSWAVNHMRDAADIAQDKSRNIKILDEMPNKDARMKFYHGKELYEARRPFEAVPVFESALKEQGLEHHDRLLSYQYGAYAAMACFDMLNAEAAEEKRGYAQKVLEFCSQGIKFDPNRAEFHCAMGDMYLKAGQLVQAIPCFAAAKHSMHSKANGLKFEGAIYSFLNCYGEIPTIQLAKIYAQIGDLTKAKKEAMDALSLYKSEEAKSLLAEIERIDALTQIDNNQPQTEDIIFTCPPQTAYEFDEEIYKTKPLGGSETALVQMARLLKKKTGRPVKVFNMRQSRLTAESGVEYIPNSQLNEYLSKNKPRVNIAWRHNIRLTLAKTYLWCHDLMTQTVESFQNFDKLMCLSQFHKDYIQSMQGLPDDKIIMTRNGIDPDKFKFERKPKNPNKIVFMSSPDRGLGRAMRIMDEVIKTNPQAELHVYYGIEGLPKYGRQSLHDTLKVMMAERPYVKYHGFTEQNQMYHDVSDAVVWCHPATFIESYCITALEMLALGVFPVSRKLGALKNTLAEAQFLGQAILFDQKEDLLDQDGLQIPDSVRDDYVSAINETLRKKSWEKITFDMDRHSWESIASDWQKFMEL